MREIRSLALAAMLLAPAAAAEEAAPPKGDEDVVFRALKDELDRSVKRLRLDDRGPPYYVGYAVEENEGAEASASFGAVTGKGGGRTRSLAADVRVGDYSLDSSNFGGGFNPLALLGMGGFGGGEAVSVDDDYDALRHALWRATDAAYKGAVEQLEAKKAWLQQNQVKERPDDFSRETPVAWEEPKARLDADPEKWAETVRRVSAVFREFPAVQSSHVMFLARSRNRWFLNSEGFRSRRGGTEAGVVLLASAQAPDGMRLADMETFAGRSPVDLPPVEALEKAARALAGRLTELCAAPPAEEYRGPVLFEGPAAADFLHQAVAAHVGGAHDTLGEDSGMGALMGNQWKEKIGQKVMAGFLTLVSEPAADGFRGAPLLGGWKVDDDGVKAQKVTIIEKGVLRAFCSARIPSRAQKASNGHSVGGSGAPGTLFLLSEHGLPPKDLRARAAEMAKEEGLDRVIVVRRLSNLLSAALNPQGLASTFLGAFSGGPGGVALLPPLEVVSVSLADGKETRLRGASFGAVTLRVLRDIEATGDDDAAHLVIRGPDSVSSVVTPSLLVKELELRKPGKETEKPPVLPNPWFEGREKK